jgi:beta-lactamase regulating signal transducer with metallopeptidase domain
MNTQIILLKTTGLLAGEIALLVLVAIIVERLVRSAQWRRTIWQVCMLSILLVTILELAGTSQAIRELRRKSSPSQSSPPAKISDPVFSVSAPLPANETPSVGAPIAPVSRPTKDSSRQLLFVLGWVWMLGTVMFLGRAILTQMMILRMRRSGQRIEDAGLLRIVQELAPRLGIRSVVHVMEFSRLKAPIAFGLVRRVIGLPSGFSEAHPRPQQEVIMAHELAHLAARDSRWQLVAEIAVAFTWWHPLVWLARRRLREASEATADESSLLIQNGPPVLAECLLALGKGMEQKPVFGWLNIGGEGFRSGLGRRVQRLFALNASTWNPASRVQSALVRMFCPAALVLGTVLCGGWLSPAASMKGTEMKNPMWKRSLPAFALLAFLGAEQQASAAEKPPAATPAAKRSEPKYDTPSKGKGAAMVRRKLEQIVFPSVQMDNLPLGHVIQSLIDESAKRDPEGVGVNILSHGFITEQSPPIDPATGLPVAGAVASTTDLGSLTVRIMPPIRNVRLIDVLDAIVKMAERPIKYSIEDYGVLITAAVPYTLETRTFRINPPDNFFKGLQSAFGIDVTDVLTPPRSREAQQRIFEELFRQLGIEWQGPKSIFYNELTGIVMVRVAYGDVGAITAAMQTLGGTPISDAPVPEKPAK